MAIGQWFNDGASASSAGADRGSCPHADGEARSEWLSGFDEAVKFEAANATDEAERLTFVAANANAQPKR